MRHRETTSHRKNGSVGAVTSSEPTVSREQMIAEAAYYIAQSRGFVGDHEIDDWLLAKAEFNRQHPSEDIHQDAI